MRIRTRRAKAGLASAAVLLSGLGLGAATASPAAAAGWCNQSTTYTANEGYWTGYVPTHNGERDCTMSQGASGRAVWALQRALKYCYSQNITVDSEFGPKTRDALEAAQRSAGVTADGIYGPNTAEALEFHFLNPGSTKSDCSKVPM
ncbi:MULTISPECIES: peptidoglycan-binding domain-containing protein [unclassified Streptomyces]|uniref:peptidoglycan-binding domain-containing protein n=1 Tax=unclassified Streptomyces TaxID=2593676 RepID=UPI002366C0CA|nr:MULTISPECIES: peptidoglycan-binding domain-containing protein [unclassified Streptomyces]MDF3144541.1 peptidoglycan-binding domain-containing protein [Streptomyces sp. T21Q-yed]WDF40696.1 peptidoglycan-binding domain-containing protein [Streptomyces sp. T12]